MLALNTMTPTPPAEGGAAGWGGLLRPCSWSALLAFHPWSPPQLSPAWRGDAQELPGASWLRAEADGAQQPAPGDEKWWGPGGPCGGAQDPDPRRAQQHPEA